jgi:hypothetical protein
MPSIDDVESLRLLGIYNRVFFSVSLDRNCRFCVIDLKIIFISPKRDAAPEEPFNSNSFSGCSFFQQATDQFSRMSSVRRLLAQHLRTGIKGHYTLREWPHLNIFSASSLLIFFGGYVFTADLAEPPVRLGDGY